MSGTGTLVKQGAGSLNLTGTSTLSGPTTVSAGLLAVNGSLANSVVTLSGGTLGGSGTVGGINVQSGTVAPGNSIGTLNVAGNVGFGAGTVYRVELDGTGASDRIAATGAATLSGGQVQVLAATGAYADSTRYSILTAQGGVSGQFASVTSDLAFLTPLLSYDPNAVVLTMTRNDTDFGPQPGPRAFVAATRNQAGAANAAQSLGTGNRLYDALLGTTAEQARAGFDLLSGEAHAQAVSVAIEDSHLVRETILNRARAPFGAAASGGSVQGSFTADLPGHAAVTAMPAPAFETRRFTIWGEAIGAQGSTDRDGNAASMSRRGGGMLLGAELEQGQWRLGVAGGYTKTDFDLDARRSDGDVSSVHGALYGGARFGAIALRAGAAYAWNDVDVKRSVGFPGFADYLRLDGRSATAQAFAEIGYGMTLGPVALEPFAQIAAVTIRTEREAEQGGAAALTVLARDQSLGFTTLGLRAEMQLGALPLVARGMLGWRYAFGDTTPAADLAFVSGGLPFRSYATPIARNALLAEAGLAWKVSNAATLGVSYSAAISDKARDQALRGRIDIAF
ncbi:autotransporter domain-containing protein [Bosea caraganae]|uniref:Autotransporter domain-containing protein n=1 Tax=Bosea caraganae TaxID=2763117 RepID=A0A370L891_9HYPH|nr:autotransporter domain-containing protein [Bosea caraganae]RDJ26370.1 autotransporter domain-containing protein [Bosea caraganae]